MENSCKYKILAVIIISLAIVGAAVCFGVLSRSLATRELITVKGLSERVVKSDVGEIYIRIENKNKNLKALHQKRTADKNKTLDFLKKYGVTDDMIVGIQSDTSEQADYYDSKKESYFLGKDCIHIKTSNVDLISHLRTDIVNLSTEDVLITCDYQYEFSKFQSLKLDMINEASKNARDSAASAIRPYDSHITGVAYINQGEVSIRAEDEFECVSQWATQEKTSVNKKIRLVVNAGFFHD